MHTNQNIQFSPAENIRILSEKIAPEIELIDKLRAEIGKTIIGQETMISRLLIALLADGHILLEGVPGLAKTLAVKTLAMATGAEFSRIQFTPDLLPADVTGTLIFNQKTESFNVKKGPVFANFVLADEINRAPAKVQSALLEAMQEKQITIGEESYPLPQPFLVLATQNPIEQEGTYPLPEAQIDRFMMKVVLGYPSVEEEKKILRLNVKREGTEVPDKVITPEDLLRIKDLIRDVYLSDKIEQYIVDIVFATRFPENYQLEELKKYISSGCSPRASISLALAGKANAFLNNRAYVIPEDIRTIAQDVIGHRIGLSYEAEIDGITEQQVVQKILNKVEVP